MTENQTYQHNELFELETGGFLPGFQLRYTTLGKLNADKSNVVWVCHALTGNSDVLDWWKGLFQPKAIFDPEEYFIVCANTLGGCYGSTGPLSVNPATKAPFYHDFPEITNRDIVRAFDLLRAHLEIPKIEILLGGSLGGQHAIEWAVTYPEHISHLIAVATNAVHSPWGVAFNESQRLAIANDPTWQNNDPTAGLNGMKTARSFALLSYRNYSIYKDSQDDANEEKTDDYRASSYQRYQGDKLAKRFNAFSYWYLSKAMDSHHVGRHRGGIEAALAQIKAKSLFVGIRTDLLFPMDEQIFLAAHVKSSALDIIDSRYGHDGFLVETDQITRAIRNFYQKKRDEQMAWVR